MAIIILKKLQDFKDLVVNLNVTVMYKIDGDILELYIDHDNIYKLSLKIINLDEVELFLDQNFEDVLNIEEIE